MKTLPSLHSFLFLLSAVLLMPAARVSALTSIWDTTFNAPGADSFVYTMAETAADIYYGGSFRTAGDVRAANVVRFQKSDSTWHTLAEGTNGAVYKILAVGTDIYVSGNFTTAGTTTVNYIAKWNGSAWSALGTGLGGGVDFLRGGRDMIYFGGNLYVAGHFTSAGGVTVGYIAKWSGTAWSALGTGLSDESAALAVIGTDLYVAGGFLTAGGVTCKGIAKWDGGTWTALHSDGLGNGDGYALAVIGTDLYVGGYFSRAGTVLFGADNLAKWNGSTFSTVGGDVDDTVKALAVNGGTLYVAGEFTQVGAVSASRVAQWNGSAWSVMGTGMNGDVLTLGSFTGGVVFAGGNFSSAGNVAASNLAKWTGIAWEAVTTGKGVTGTSVSVMKDTGTHIYVGGSFVGAGPLVVNHVARFDKATETWSALGSGVNVAVGGFGGASVSDILVDGTDVYVAGSFDHAGGVAANNIAKWNGSSWSALGSGFNSSVSALAKIGSTLYAAGFFSASGAVSASNIAKWDGSAWTPLGTGIDDNGYVTDLEVIGADLYVGGGFATAGGNPAANIAKWNGTVWSALGSGLTDDAEALLADGGTLYVAGEFSSAGGVAQAKYIAVWNGSAWSALGTGLGFYATALAKSGANLFVGGQFSQAGGSPARYVAVWNGAAWEPVAEDLTGLGFPDPAVRAIVVNDSTAYFGSTLIRAGNVPFGKFGKATLAASSNKPLVSIIGGTLPTKTGRTIVGTVNPKGLATTAALNYGTTVSLGLTKGIPLSPANGAAAQNVSIVLTGLVPGTQYFYRLTATNSAGTSETEIYNFTTLSAPVITVPPTSQFVVKGADVNLTATVTGSPTLAYQWLKKTSPIPGALGLSYFLPDITLAQAGEYGLKVTNSLGFATSPLAKVCVIDTEPMIIGVKAQTTFSFTAPAAGPGLTFQWYKHDVMLTNGGLGGRVSGASSAKLSLTKFTAADEDYYTCKVKLGADEKESGHITALLQSPPQIAAVAPGLLPHWIVSGTVNAPITALITFVDPLPQNLPTKYVITNLPPGVVYDTTTGHLSGKPTKEGNFKIKILASNGAGSMLPAVETAAVNVAGLPALVVGTFNGLINRSSLLNTDYGGSLNVLVSLAGGCSGKLIMSGKPYPFTGVLDAVIGGNATAEIQVKAGASFFELTITLNSTYGELTGNLAGNGNAGVRAWRNPWKTTAPANPATALAAHPYTARLQMTTPNASASYPQGDGYGLLTITTAGVATWKGQLADGTPMTCSTTMGPQGQIPLHVMLYTNTGSFQGWVQAVANTTNAPVSYVDNTLDNLSGETVSWFKNQQPANSTTRYYKGGIPLHNLTVTGGAWPKLLSPNLVLGISDATGNNNTRLTFSSSGVESSAQGSGSPIQQALRIKAPSNTVSMPTGLANPATVKLTLTAASGLLTGSFVLKDANPILTSQTVTRTNNYYGVLVKRLSQGAGHLLLAKLPAAQGQTPTNTAILSGKVLLEIFP